MNSDIIFSVKTIDFLGKPCDIIIQKLLKNEVLTGKEMIEFISKKQ